MTSHSSPTANGQEGASASSVLTEHRETTYVRVAIDPDILALARRVVAAKGRTVFPTLGILIEDALHRETSRLLRAERITRGDASYDWPPVHGLPRGRPSHAMLTAVADRRRAEKGGE